MEGVYLRIDGADGCALRGKVVRADFQRGIEEGEHWAARVLERNKLQF